MPWPISVDPKYGWFHQDLFPWTPSMDCSTRTNFCGHWVATRSNFHGSQVWMILPGPISVDIELPPDPISMDLKYGWFHQNQFPWTPSMDGSTPRAISMGPNYGWLPQDQYPLTPSMDGFNRTNIHWPQLWMVTSGPISVDSKYGWFQILQISTPSLLKLLWART